MTNPSRKPSKSFTAFTSARDEATAHSDEHEACATPQVDQGQRGADAMPDEFTTLERRVLAHERILQALICDLADDDSRILDSLRTQFGEGHNMGEYENDFVSTDHYGQHFIRMVEARLKQRRHR